MSDEWSAKAVETAGHANRKARADEALELMNQALQLLDDNGAPDDAGAHLDCAINRLREWMTDEAGPSDQTP
jgi:hypothetical protein